MSQSSVNQVLGPITSRTIYDVTIFCKSSVRVTPMVFNGLRTIYDVTIFCKSSVRVTPMVFNVVEDYI